MNLSEALARQFMEQSEQSEQPSTPKRPLPIQARVLGDMLEIVQRPNLFKVGDLVIQDPRRRKYRWPDEGFLALVTGVVEAGALPATKGRGGDDVFNREDMIIMVEVDGKWIEFAVESWRFEKYTGPVER